MLYQRLYRKGKNGERTFTFKLTNGQEIITTDKDAAKADRKSVV